MAGIVIGLVGSPGVGKGYVVRNLMDRDPNLEFLYKITTRETRSTDSSEGVMAISQNEFDDLRGDIIAQHRPFNDDRRYGWYLNGAVDGILQGKNYIADPNIDFLDDFKTTFGNRLHLIGLVAGSAYIESNLLARTVSENNGLNENHIPDLRKRLDVNNHYSLSVQEAYQRGVVNSLIKVDFYNRHQLVGMVEESIIMRQAQMAVEGNGRYQREIK